MSEFEREVRYVVLKIKDALAYLSACQLDRLQEIGEAVAAGRAEAGKPPFNAVVVEQDWPEFDLVWQMIEARMKGQSYHLILPPLADRFSALKAERDGWERKARGFMDDVLALAESVAYWKADSGAAWDRCEERRKENEVLAAQVVAMRESLQKIYDRRPANTIPAKYEYAVEQIAQRMLVLDTTSAESILRERDAKVQDEMLDRFRGKHRDYANEIERELEEERRAGK